MSASPLTGKRIVLGVTGGIAAYKAIELSRRLVDAGAHVVPIMTDAAQHFVGATTLGALASEPVQTELWNNPTTPIPHTKVGQGADLIIVAPATAKSIAAYRMGYSHDLLQNTLIATRAPVIVCPAMHTEMWEHPSVVDNIATLRKRGVHIVEPESGRLAGGDMGAGRLADPATILGAAERILGPADLTGVRVVVSAGGTREPIDAVRVIANRSSGKQGYALAAAAADAGAHVILVSGPTNLTAPDRVELIQVISAQDMHEAVQERIALTDVFIGVAAVADYRPKLVQQHKIKKDQNGQRSLTLELVENPDVIAEVAMRADKPFTIGFAAETEQVEAYARKKLIDKKLDMIVANNVGNNEIGFNSDVNAITVYFQDRAIDLPTMSKRILSEHLVELISQQLTETL